MQSMKIVYYYVLPLLILALSVNYLQGSNNPSTETAIAADDTAVTASMDNEFADGELLSHPAEKLSADTEYDELAAFESVDEENLTHRNREESDDYENARRIEDFVAMYTDDLTGAAGIDAFSSDVLASEDSGTNDPDKLLDKINADHSSGQVLNIEISGNQISTTQSGVTINEVYGNESNEVYGGESAANDATQHEEAVNDMPYQDVADLTEQQNTLDLSCPDTLYMGGNAYAASMLKKRGCPKPSNYQGPW